MRIDNIRNVLANDLAHENFVYDKTGVKTIEIVGAHFSADEVSIFKKPSEDYIRRELDWYNLQSRNVYDIEAPVPKIWKDIASSEGYINSNYGWCIYSEENGSQYDKTHAELSKNPDSRRAIMIYTRPSMHEDYNHDGMSDFICTNSVQYLIRNGRLRTIVNMRSNDAISGYRNDYAWQLHVAEKLGADLGVELGPIIWNAGSFHVYERDFYLIDHYIQTGETDITKAKYRELYPDNKWG